MQEAGVPVTYGYISDIHERKDRNLDCTTAGATSGVALGPGDACYMDNAQGATTQAFAKFFDRLANDGITPRNTLFVIGAEENDHLAGANVGRASAPTDPAGCDGVTVPCTLRGGQIGELQANLPRCSPTRRQHHRVRRRAAGRLDLRARPARAEPTRSTAAGAGPRPHHRRQPVQRRRREKIVNYQAGTTEQRILHLQTADPQRTPTVTVFPKADYFFDASVPDCARARPRPRLRRREPAFAWNHGYYSPDIDITWSAFVGPRGPGPRRRRSGRRGAARRCATRTAAAASRRSARKGTWADETDVRPTMLLPRGAARRLRDWTAG